MDNLAFMKNSAKKIELAHFKTLVAVAVDDNHLDNEEIDFLTEKALEFGFSIDEMNFIISNANQININIPKKLEDKENLLSEIVYISMKDGVIHKTEYNRCSSVAKKIGLNQKDLDFIISLTQKLWKTMNK